MADSVTAPAAQQPPPIDGADEADLDAMEVAIGVALAAMLIIWFAPGPNSILGKRGSWRRQIIDRIGFTLRNFIARSAQDLAAASGVPGASAAAAEATDEVYPQVVDALVRWSEDTMRHLTPSDVIDGQPSEKIQTAAETLTRAVASYARNEVRDRTAGKIGVVWSEWRSRHDDRVRGTHQGLNGTQVPFGGLFVTDTGATLRFPGDPDAPLEETMGCRCHLAYRLKSSDDYAEV